jgi:hypothetical protein
MKKFTLIAAILFAGFAANAQVEKTSTPQPVQQPQPKDIAKYVEFKNPAFDFGKIPMGKPAEYQLVFKNISHDTLTLERVQPSCGCTTPKYEANKKIAPGQSYEVTLGYNAASEGVFNKTVTIFFNDGMTQPVTFKGEVYKTPENAAPANGAAEKMKTGGNK